jgi:predicted Zn-dependent protease
MKGLIAAAIAVFLATPALGQLLEFELARQSCFNAGAFNHSTQQRIANCNSVMASSFTPRQELGLVYEQRAFLHLENGDRVAAESDAQRAHQTGFLQSAQRLLALIAIQNWDLDRARDLLLNPRMRQPTTRSDAVEAEEQRGNATLRAHLWLIMGDFQAVQSELDAALRLAEPNLMYFIIAGDLALARGETQRAFDFLSQASRINQHAALLSLCALNARSLITPEACERLRREVSPNSDWWIAVRTAEAVYRMRVNQIDQADRLLAEVLQRQPADPMALYIRSQLRLRQGNPAAARTDEDRARQRYHRIAAHAAERFGRF